MADTPSLGFHCTNPECGKLFKMKYPGKEGLLKVSCPHCGSKVTVKMPPPSQLPGQCKSPDTTPPGEKKNLQAPDNSDKPIRDYTEYPDGLNHFHVGEQALLLCPHCRNKKMSYTAKNEGKFTFTCPGCHGKVRAAFVNPTEMIATENFNNRQGCLVQVRSLWRSVTHPLPLGEHTIGRMDMQLPSTISVKGDNTMSRRSVSIHATISAAAGFTYKLCVLSATNPVFLSGRCLTQGEEVYLNFGDELRLGKTTFRFEPDPKAPGINNF